MSQTNIDVSAIALGLPGIPQPIADALLALQTGHNDTDTKLTNITSGHNHDGVGSRALTIAALSDFLAWTSFTSAWTNTGTANTLGNGVLTGKKAKFGIYAAVNVTLTWGSTTS